MLKALRLPQPEGARAASGEGARPGPGHASGEHSRRRGRMRATSGRMRATRQSAKIERMQPDNLITLKDDMIAFIAGHGMRRLPAYVTEDVPSVLFEEDTPDSWKDFVEHAKAAGASFITMSEVVLEKEDVSILLEQLREQSFPDSEADEIADAEYLVRHVGKIGYLQLGFAHQGIVFLFETATEWYDRFQNLMETITELGSIVVDDRDEE